LILNWPPSSDGKASSKFQTEALPIPTPELRSSLQKGRNERLLGSIDCGTGAAQMAEYRAYLIGKDGLSQHRIDLICADDDAAKECANLLVDDCDSDIELWQFDRKIATFVHKQ